MSSRIAKPVKGRQARSHEQARAREMARDVKRRWGYAFDMLGDELRECVAAKELVTMIALRADYNDDCARLFECWLQLCADLEVLR